MSHSFRRPFQLAHVTGLSDAEVLSRLRAAGVAIVRSRDLIPKADLARAFAAVGIDSRTGPIPRAQAPKPTQLPAVESEEIREPKKARRRKGVQPKRVKKPRLGLVGHPVDSMAYLTAKDVEQIHWCLVDDFAQTRDPIEPPGVKDRNMLESALFRVHTTLDAQRKYPTVPMAAAGYLHALIGNHPFHNGNKRTALVAVLVFLDVNSYVLEVEENLLFEYLLKIASHDVAEPYEGESTADLEMHAIAKWLSGSCRFLSTADHPLKFHELREILTGYGCEFSHPQRGNRINVYRGHKKVQVYYRNDGTDVEINTIKRVRTELGFLERDGYDSFIFYNAKRRIPDFILKYRKTLDRLAKV